MRWQTAQLARLALGVVMAVGLGVGGYLAEGGGLLTYLLPLAILLLTLADFLGYLGSAASAPKSADPGSEAQPLKALFVKRQKHAGPRCSRFFLAGATWVVGERQTFV